MRFLCDESLEHRVASGLLVDGHDVTIVGRHYPASLPDQQVLAYAYAEGRVLLTNDRDFGDLVFRQRHPHAGVVYFRLRDATGDEKSMVLRQLLTARPAAYFEQFIVVTPTGARVRSR